MHFLHAILVDLDAKSQAELGSISFEQAKEEARDRAMSDTENYDNGEVFDWRTEYDASRWCEEYPGLGVVLGAEEPERFATLLKDFSRAPLESALSLFKYVETRDFDWRTMEEMKELGYEVPPSERPTRLREDGEVLYWSGKRTKLPTIDRDFLISLWGDNHEPFYVYNLAHMLQLVSGQYRSESLFYSCPDYSTKISDEVRDKVESDP